MNALKILIVEDEFSTALEIEEQLLDWGYLITDNVRNDKAALRAFRRRIPDLVIMDINLEGSELDGIALAQLFNEAVRVPIIYLTAYADQATVDRAKSTQPAYYLVKPAIENQLKIAIDFAIFNFAQKQRPQINHSLTYHAPLKEQLEIINNFFFVKKSNRYVRIDIADVLWIEAMSSTIKIVSTQGNVAFSVTLQHFSKQIQHTYLLRVHRSFIINTSKVKEFDNHFLVVHQKRIPIGRTYKEKVFEQLKRLQS